MVEDSRSSGKPEAHSADLKSSAGNAQKRANTRVIENATCTFCGCVCDDQTLTVDMDAHRITNVKNTCVLGRAWFTKHVLDTRRPFALVDGKPASTAEGVEAAARILAEARFPLIYGLSNTTCEAQCEAVAIADFIGGTVDTTTSVCHGPTGIAFQSVGESTCTLGEIRNRADLVVFWGGNPAESHPRLFGRYAVTPKGMFIPNGKHDRTVVLVDVRRTRSTPVADIFIQVKPGCDFEVLWALRALVKGRRVDPSIEERTGVPLTTLADLVERMKNCRFGALLFGMGLTMTPGRHFNAGAILALATDLNAYTHFVAKPVRGHGNVTGADNVVSWQTGFPFGVNFSRGYPRFNPGEFTSVDVLSRGDADAALIIASDPASNFPKAAVRHLRRIPVIALDPNPTYTTRLARVAFTIATYGINTPGTVYRMDDVPIALRPAFESHYPSDEEVLSAIKERLHALLLTKSKVRARGGTKKSKREVGVVTATPTPREFLGEAAKVSSLRIVNGKVYDPANGINGKVRDICVKDGKIVKSVPADAKRINAHGLVVMPGGVDIHCHIAGPKVNLARKLQPEDHRFDVHPRTPFTRSGTGGTVPSTFTTGYRYATLGYTTAMEAAVPPIAARHALHELHDTPIIDKGFFVLMGNNLLLYRLLEQKRHAEFRDALAWWLNASRGYTPKLVNPGGDEPWKGQRNAILKSLDEKIGHFDLTPRQVIKALVDAADDLGLPHPAHIHCNNLGHSGNFKTTLETMRATEGRRAHFAHIQFHSYGGKAGDDGKKRGGNPTSEAPRIVEYINANPNISADVGQVMFGRSTIMTADAPLAYLLRRFSKDKRWINADTECESGCGIIPFAYQEHIYTHALQWAMGLELFLLSKDPWRIVLSTDHPNGGSFMSYPRLIRLLMDREFRKQQIDLVNKRAIAKIKRSHLLERAYTLQEIAIITRAGPARLLGLKNKGHLGVGADADITIYEEDDNKEKMFSAPRYVIKDGRCIIEDFEFRTDHQGRTLHVAPGYDTGIEKVIRPFFEDYYSLQFDNYAVADSYLHHHQLIPVSD